MSWKKQREALERRAMACWNNDAAQENEALIENAVDVHSDFYNMSHRKTGTAVIFDHKYFAIPDFNTRHGTRADCEKLTKALKHLGFAVKVYKDLTCNDLMQKVREEADADHSESDAFVMAVLTHGQKDFLYANDGLYKYDILWTSFTDVNCPSLSNKPKVFFIEACQIYASDSGVIPEKPNADEEILPYGTNLNLSDDFLIAFSTLPGNYSFRNRKKGSWFIQALSSKLKKHGRNLPLLSLLNAVSQHVANAHVSHIPDNPMLDKKKQIPCVSHSLKKLLIFPKKPRNRSRILTSCTLM